MRVKIFLHGHLRDKIKRDFVETEASTVMDALQFLAFTYKEELKAPLDIGRWKIKVKDYECKDSWCIPLGENELHIYPIFKTGKGNWAQVIVGSALMVVGAVTSYLGAPQVGMFLVKVGAAMALSGVVTLLFPTPKLDTMKSTDSKYLGAQGNTVAVGTRIPFGYGLFKISGHYISYNVSSTKIREIV